MKKQLRSLMLMLVLLCSLLCGCVKSEPAAEANLAIVSGYRSNSATPNFSAAEPYISDALLSYGSISVIVADGDPYVAAAYDINAPAKDLSRQKRHDIAAQQAAMVGNVLTNSTALTAECDLLAALDLAARALRDADGAKTLLVLDSGIPTCGFLDGSLLRADSESYVAYLRDKQALPDLSEVRVVWVGLGDVAGSQDKPTPANKRNLQDTLSAILYAGGAASVTFDAALPGKAATCQLPPVTPVPIVAEDPFGISDFAQPLVLDESKLLFKPDSREFADAEAAAQVLRPVAQALVSDRSLSVVLAGTTASIPGNQHGCMSFSAGRAETVAEALCRAGVAESQIAAVLGLGFEHPYHIPDRDAAGALNENAPANRSVIIFNADTAAAKALL